MSGPKVNPWIVTVAVMLATFMEILDTTIVNVSIPHISGNLAATYEEGTWVVTSYLVANAIILPLAGWLARRFGRRKLLLLCVGGFTLTSMACAMASSLSWLIFFRVMQGLTGGGLQPLSQAVLLETFPRKKHGQAMAAFGLGIILAPIIGPTLGGWITDNYSWRWIFYMNLPVGALSLFLMAQFVHDPDYLSNKHEKPRMDLWGIGLLALGLGTLQVILDTGQRKDWLASNEIRFYTVCCVVGLIAFVVRELWVEQPVVDLRALKDKAFSAGVFLVTMVGFILYASLVLLPIYLQTLLGYPALQAGLALSPRGIGALLFMPIVGVMTSKFDPRKLLWFGFIVGCWSMYALSRLDLNAGYWDIFWPQIAQGVSMSCMFIPLTATCMSHFPKQKIGNVTSIFNLMRNIGGSFGIAMMTTFLARRQQMHQTHLVEKVTPYDMGFREMLNQLTMYFRQHGSDPITSVQRGYAAVYGMVQKQAAMLSFVEAFWVMAAVYLVLFPFVLLLRNPRKAERDEARKGSAPEQSSPEREPELELVH